MVNACNGAKTLMTLANATYDRGAKDGVLVATTMVTVTMIKPRQPPRPWHGPVNANYHDRVRRRRVTLITTLAVLRIKHSRPLTSLSASK